MSEEGNVLTFSELRKTQKKEDREEELADLGEKFLLRVSNYFDKKKKTEGENSREYKNARRVLDKIISLREEKIVKEARLSVKTDGRDKEVNLLPEEQELFRKLKSDFEKHRSRVDEKIDSESLPAGGRDPSEEVTKEVKKAETDEEPVEGKENTRKVDAESNSKVEESSTDKDSRSEEEAESIDEAEEGYSIVKTTSNVPEFMGTDLEAYGPFDEGERVEIPDDNAEILVNRGNAERIED
jgi:DNA replication initiation complex subunit (GINS family)